MLVKCIAVPKERTPKKVEVILTRVIPAERNVIRINARVAETAPAKPENDIVCDVVDDVADISSEPAEAVCPEEISDNLEGITPVIEYYSAPEYDCDEPSVSEPEEEIDIEDLENDLLSLITGDLEEAEEEEAVVEDDGYALDYDDEIIQRHFIRGDTGELVMSDSEESADGHEVACYDNEGKLKRACGVIRKGQGVQQSDSDDDSDDNDIFSQAVADMFSNSDD